MNGLEVSVALEREVVIPNREGLHFRPIMQFVDTAARFRAQVTVHCQGRKADGRSPMELLMLVATQGCALKVTADGEDAQAVLDALTQLVEAGFSET
jgi:phosphocarrier protein HPr